MLKPSMDVVDPVRPLRLARLTALVVPAALVAGADGWQYIGGD